MNNRRSKIWTNLRLLLKRKFAFLIKKNYLDVKTSNAQLIVWRARVTTKTNICRAKSIKTLFDRDIFAAFSMVTLKRSRVYYTLYVYLKASYRAFLLAASEIIEKSLTCLWHYWNHARSTKILIIYEYTIIFKKLYYTYIHFVHYH